MTARARIHAMFPLDEPATAELDQRLDAHRTEVLVEAKIEVVAWLVKKAREGCNVADLASKVDRGAVRIFLGAGHYRDAMDACRAEALIEAAVEAENAVALFEDGDEAAMAAGAMEGLAVRFRRMAGENGTREGDATPDSSREKRLAQLLDSIRTHRGKWSTRQVQEIRRLASGPTQRGTARRDLAELHRRGHLVRHGAGDGRFYLLATRKDGAR